MSLTYSVYVTAQSVERYGKIAEERKRIVEDVQRMGATKVFLEIWRGAFRADLETLKLLKESFEAVGISTGTGIMPVRGRDVVLSGTTQWDSDAALGGNSRWGADLCYSRPWTRQMLKDVMQAGARIFDEFIIDDALCTQCTCPRCRDARGEKSWSLFRRDLLVDISREELVAACKEVNPDIHMILKFPQWYDRLHCFGYDTERQPSLFDATCVGTETRDPDTADFGYVPQYEACFNVRWHDDGEPNLEGVWFDNLDCDPTTYVEQAYQSVIAGARHMTLFCYEESLFRGNDFHLSALRSAQPKLEKLARRLDGQKPTGITAIRPHNSEGGADGYIFDGLGMVGFPLVPLVNWPESTPEALLVTSHIADDPQLTTKVAEVVEAGGTVFMTAGLLALRDDDYDLKALAGYGDDGWSQATPWTASEWEVGDLSIKVHGAVEMRFDLRPSSAEILAEGGATAHWRTEWIPIITRQEDPSGGAVVVLNVCGAAPQDFPMSEGLNVPIVLAIQEYPIQVLNVMQQQIARAVGQSFLTPARVAVYPFKDSDGNVDVVIENFTDRAVTATVIGRGLSSDAFDFMGTATVSDEAGSDSIGLLPRSVALISDRA